MLRPREGCPGARVEFGMFGDVPVSAAASICPTVGTDENKDDFEETLGTVGQNGKIIHRFSQN